jgi:hypothetical protein
VVVYVILTAPEATPVTTPPALTVATEELLVVHAPPETPLVSAVVTPTQTEVAPEIVPAEGRPFTVTANVSMSVPHPFVTVYRIEEVPAAIPDTRPAVPTVATVVFNDDQAPASDAPEFESVTLPPSHNVEVPEIVPAAAVGLTVSTAVAATVPQLFVTA